MSLQKFSTLRVTLFCEFSEVTGIFMFFSKSKQFLKFENGYDRFCSKFVDLFVHFPFTFSVATGWFAFKTDYQFWHLPSVLRGQIVTTSINVYISGVLLFENVKL